MKKNNKLLLFTLSIFTTTACRIQSSGEYEGLLSSDPLTLLSRLKVADILGDNSLLYLISTVGGVLFFILGIIFFFLHRKDKSWLYLSLSALAGGIVYSLPLWVGRVSLPPEFWSPLMVRTFFLLIYYWMYRSWCRKALYHRTKVWASVLSSILVSLTLIAALLSGHFPGILTLQWPVPLLATALIMDSLVNSIMSFQRKDDPSGIAGMMTLPPLVGVALWYWLSRGFGGLTPFLNNVYYALPSILIPWQLILTIGLIQSRYNKEEKRNLILAKMVEDEELQKEKLEEIIENLEAQNEENTRIPDYSLECARRLLGHRNELSPKLPSSWTGSQRLSSESPLWPILGVWSRDNTLLFAENTGKESLIPLLYLQEIFKSLKMEKPAQMFKSMNDKMCSLPQNLESGLSGIYLYFLENELICGTAGSVRIYLQKKEGKIIPIQAEDKPVTYKEGLGVRAQTREDGKPFRLVLEKGDRIVLVSCSLTDRELDVSGELYGQKSLYRVLNSHITANPEDTVKAILKDFDDFDLGNPLDRQIYAGVFLKN